MPITQQKLLQILPNAGQVAGVFVSVLSTAMARHQIVGTKRISAFIAQVGRESGQLTRLVENLNYRADGLANTWPTRYVEPDGKGGYVKVLIDDESRNKPSALGLSLARKPEQITKLPTPGAWNTEPGDGWKYRGRGLIQLTGKTNYRLYGEALDRTAELLEKPQHTCMAIAWNGLNTLADAGKLDAITQRINGDQTGPADR